jgi:6-phosphogluconolactonase (cycloisomerase 2 family)
MKRIPILLILLALFAACDSSKTKEMTPSSPIYSFLVGTYTDSTNQGINLLKFAPENNSLTVETIFEEINNPSFLLANRAENLVISLEEDATINGGNLMVFGLAGEKLTPIDTIPSYGDHPCYIGFSPNEQFVVAANYTGGSLSIYKLNPSNHLSHLQTIQHNGRSINESRQEKAHVHSTVFSPDGEFLLVADLGTDKIYSYAFNQSDNEPASLYSTFEAQPGDGPRHVLFSVDGKTVFVVQELTAILEIFDFEAGKLIPRQRLSLLADNFEGSVGAAEVRISPDEKHVYVSNRGEANSISVFQKVEATQDFERIQVISSGGIMPRNFNLTSDGKYLICAHQASNDIVIFERDSDSGILTQTDWKVQVNKPVYLFPLKN